MIINYKHCLGEKQSSLCYTLRQGMKMQLLYLWLNSDLKKSFLTLLIIHVRCM